MVKSIINIGIVESRRRNTSEDYIKVWDALDKFLSERISDSEIMIVSGGASKGADVFAEKIAKQCNYHITIYRPQYEKWDGKDGYDSYITRKNRVAPLIRNELIAKQSEILIACVSSDRTGGTEDTIRKFTKFHPDGKLILV